jgi:hypothetical protein
VPKLAKTKARGYGARHKALRRKWARIVEAGEAYCSRCGRSIWPDEAWDLDHEDDRNGYRGPAHRYCNRAAPRRNSRAWGARRDFPRTKRRESVEAPKADDSPEFYFVDGEPVPRGWNRR